MNFQRLVHDSGLSPKQWPSCLLLASALILSSGYGLLAAHRLPDDSLNLQLRAPIARWDEAIPLGNGAMGVLLWGEGRTLRLSLDRGDLWDERPAKRFTEVRDKFNWRTMQQLVASNRMEEFNDITGIRKECVMQAVRHGIAKINIGTATRQPYELFVKESVAKAQQAVYDAAVRVIREDLEV